MNPTLYTQLSDLGFGEWLRKHEHDAVELLLPLFDSKPIDSTQRTELNALAFRWLREENGIDFWVRPFMGSENIYSICLFDFNKKEPISYGNHQSHPIAEHEALNKAVEILSKGGYDE